MIDYSFGVSNYEMRRSDTEQDRKHSDEDKTAVAGSRVRRTDDDGGIR